MESKEKILSNLIWRFLERSGAQMVSFVVTVIITRIVSPEEYGTVALIAVFIQILNVFSDSGLATSLIQKKDADQLDFSTVFLANVLLSVIAYFFLFGMAPIISGFFKDAGMTSLIRIAGISLLIGGVKNVQQAYVSSHLLFKKFFYSTLGGTIAAAIIGIVMAYFGFGAWALVIQGLVNSVIDTVILFITVKWRPSFKFSYQRFQTLFHFGWKMLVSSILDTIYGNLCQLIIGRIYSTKDLAYYNKGKQIPNLIVININCSIDSVLLPVMAKAQDEASKVKELTRKSIKICVYCMAPTMIGLCAVAEPLIRLLLTEKWLFTVPYLRIFSICYIFYPIHTANLNAIQALGRSDIFLKLEICKKVIGVIAIIISMQYGVLAMAYSTFITCFASQIINSWPNRKLLGYSYVDQVRDILPSLSVSIVMGAVVYSINFIDLSDVMTLVLQIATGCCVYILASRQLKLDAYTYLLNMVKPYITLKGKTNG